MEGYLYRKYKSDNTCIREPDVTDSWSENGGNFEWRSLKLQGPQYNVYSGPCDLRLPIQPAQYCLN